MAFFEKKKVFIFAVNAYTAALSKVTEPNALLFFFGRGDSRLFRLMSIFYVVIYVLFSNSKNQIYIPHFKSLFIIFRPLVSFLDIRIIDDGTTLLERSCHDTAFIKAARRGVICGLENHYFQSNSVKVPRARIVEEIQRISQQSVHTKRIVNCLIVGDGVLDDSVLCDLKRCGLLKNDDISFFKKHPSQISVEDFDESPAEAILTYLSGGILVGRMSTVLLNSLCFDSSITVFTVSNPTNYELSDFFSVIETGYAIELSGAPSQLYEIQRLTDVDD